MDIEQILAIINDEYLSDFGKEGEGWDYDEATDTYTVHKVEGGEAITPTNSWPGLLDDRFKGRVEYDEDHAWAKRLTAIELYGDNIMDVNHIIPPMYMSSNSIKNSLNSYTCICESIQICLSNICFGIIGNSKREIKCT